MAVRDEIINRGDYLGGEKISTVYFGGGTPSVLSSKEIEKLMNEILRMNVSDDIEINFEANPDDLTEDYLNTLALIGINRLSIGVQSFDKEDLLLMRRSHSVKQAFLSIERAYMCGFGNISIDLIYGLPGMDTSKWVRNLKLAAEFGIPHISAYHLTYEQGTVFNHWKNKGRLKPVSDDDSVEQFRVLRQIAAENAYEHYEISNFAKSGYISQHNMNYWMQVPYLGVGPAAHSFNRVSRRWNVASVNKYLEGTNIYEEEILTEEDRYNEYIMTSLRTMWGVDTEKLYTEFGQVKTMNFLEKMRIYIERSYVRKNKDCYILTENGMFLADDIISDLFISEETSFPKHEL